MQIQHCNMFFHSYFMLVYKVKCSLNCFSPHMQKPQKLMEKQQPNGEFTSVLFSRESSHR